jgi:hypothetical protein
MMVPISTPAMKPISRMSSVMASSEAYSRSEMRPRRIYEPPAKGNELRAVTKAALIAVVRKVATMP